jgi:cytochrome c556
LRCSTARQRRLLTALRCSRQVGGGGVIHPSHPKRAMSKSRSTAVSRRLPYRRITLGACALLMTASSLPLSAADPAPNPKPVIDVRRALFTLIGSNFRPVGDTLQGKIPYDAAEIQKRVARVAFLAPQLSEVFPDYSATGDTKAKPEIWSNRADFDNRLKDFQTHVTALAQVADKEPGNVDAFKAAAAAVGKDCKGCHDEYKAK